MSTSKLQIAIGNLLDKTFPQFRIRENYHPDWLLSPNLTKLELDFFIEELNIAFEVQGAQHYEFIPHFHGDINGFQKRKSYDEEKKNLCYGAGVRLIEVFTLMDALIEIKTIEDKVIREGLGENKGEWFVGNPITPKYPISKPIKKIKSAEDKYRKDAKKFVGENPIIPEATKEQKIQEINQCRKKFRKFYNQQKDGIPYFKFQYLNYEEQCALLEEFNIQLLNFTIPNP